MLLSIQDCQSVEDCKELLSTLESLTDKQFARLSHLPAWQHHFRKDFIEYCKAIILFDEEVENGLTYNEILLLFYLRHCPSTFCHRISLAVKQQFEAVTSASAIFEEYEARKNALKQKTELPKTQKK